jgi:hypothetical protein
LWPEKTEVLDEGGRRWGASGAGMAVSWGLEGE